MKKKSIWLMVFLLAFLVAVLAGQQDEKAQPTAGNRNFVLIFEILDYSREMGDAVEFFFDRILQTGDQLIVYTPARVYGFSKNTLSKPKRELIKNMQDHLRSDTNATAATFNNIVNDMKNQVRDVESSRTTGADVQAGIKSALTMYRQNMGNLQALRKVNENLLMQMVGMFQTQKGENHLILIYQVEFRPIPNKEILSRLREIPILAFEATELFSSDSTKSPFNADPFSAACREVPITLHFLYINPKDTHTIQDIKEHSVDMYQVFSKIAQTTGGVVETTANPEAALEAVAKAIQNSEK